MKMEVLSVQNQYQGQFGVIGSTKNKDWTSPLTPPPPPPPQPPSSAFAGSASAPQQHHHHQIHHHNPHHHYQHYKQNNKLNNHHQQQQLQQQKLSSASTKKATANKTKIMESATAAVTATAAAMDRSNNHHLHHPHALNISRRYTAYNNNLLCYTEQPIVAALAAQTPEDTTPEFFIPSNTDDIDAGAINKLAQRIQVELRAAKSRHLACTEVSLPYDLMPRIAAEIIRTSEREPCGVRGCAIFIEFEDEPNNIRRIASFQVDPDTVSTFELYLTLKQDKSGWTSLLPQFLKNLTRSSTISISPDFTLTKNKLYACE